MIQKHIRTLRPKKFVRYTALFLGLACITLATAEYSTAIVHAAEIAERVVEMEGVGTWNGNEEKARNAAIADAKWRAVRHVRGKSMNDSQINDYVKTYRVIGGGREGSRYVVRLAVTVLDRPDSKMDKKMLRWGGNPRIMVVVPETLIGRPRVPDPAAETEIIKMLIEAKFRVLESSDIARFRYSRELEQIIEKPDVSAIKRAGAKYHCDILIIGEAFSEAVDSPIQGYRAAEARVEVKAFVVDTGEIIAACAETAGGNALGEATAGKEALKNAGTLVSDCLIPRIKDDRTGGSKTYNIRISGLRSAQQLYNLEAAFNKIAGVSSVQRRNYVSDRGVANLEIETNLLNAQLSRQLGLVKTARLRVISSTGQQINLAIKR